MKKYVFILALWFAAAGISANAVELGYYLPDNGSYNKKIPTPESVLGFQVGELHASHEHIVSYIKAVAAVSDRVRLVQYGFTFERKPLYYLIFSSPENQKNLEQIKAEHLKLSDPSTSASVRTDNLPVFTWLGHGIHGNEASGPNAALLLIYHLAAATDAETLKWLDESVIFVDPALNPDGINRFAEWVNHHKSDVPNDDTQEREHFEAWPGGRGNHYWFDLNRDWLNLQQPESKGRIAALIEWRPNVYTDAHEQGSEANYHFSPGEPTRVHPLIPDECQEFIRRLAKDYYAPAFDKQGVLYFSGEVFDDYYPGRGREYLDFHGGIALLWEQPSARGFLQATQNGQLSFEFAIRNQLTTGLATIRGSHAMKKELLDYQKWYFKKSIDDAAKDKVKAYVFGASADRAALYHLAELVKRNNIRIYQLAKTVSAAGKKFEPENSYIVPLNQPQNKLIQAIFEIREKYTDSLAYDITGWTLPFAFNLDYAGLDAYSSSLQGAEFELSHFPKGKFVGAKDAYVYAFEWDGFYAPRALYRLLDAGVLVKAAEDKFTGNGREFGRGTIVIPLGENYQTKTVAEIYSIMEKIMDEDAVDVYSFASGFTSGHNMGSGSFVTVAKPRIAVLATGSAGEIWHLFDRQYRIPVSVIAAESIGAIDLDRYNVLIVSGGSIPPAAVQAIKDWVSRGNTLIGFDAASSSFVRAGLLNAELVAASTGYNGSYDDYRTAVRAEGIAGVIFQTKVDLSHPLAWGFRNANLPVFKNSTVIFKPVEHAVSSPVVYTRKPLISGNVLPRTVDRLANTPVSILGRAGSGRVIAFSINPNFRAIWYGTSRFTANAVFFGNQINSATLIDVTPRTAGEAVKR